MKSFRLTFAFALAISGCASVSRTATQSAVTADEAHHLCYGYIYGEGLPLDYQKARVWCEKAAEAGLSSSETLYAELFYFGHGGPVDFDTAVFWYEKAAAQGHVHAQLMLYELYVVNHYKQGKYAERGVEMLRKSAASGYQKAIDVLAQYEKRA